MEHFCTLFDSNYLTRGLAMYQSLNRTHANFHLYIFAFDEIALTTLKALALKNTTVISLSEFEDSELLAIKNTRSPMEYCWTCTPSVILYCLNQYGLDRCTYLDADIYFFSSTQPIFEELGSRSILITEHRFTERYSAYAENGIYNVQFMTFKNSPEGLTTLKWWRDRCNEWCYARIEDGKLGDQKYLDDWTTRFTGVHVLQHKGGGMGPWNIQQFNLTYSKAQGLIIEDKTTRKTYPTVFYHFHNFKFYKSGYARAIFYELSKDILDLIYLPYLNEVMTQSRLIGARFPALQTTGFQPKDEDFAHIIACLKRNHYDGDNILIHDKKAFRLFRAKNRNTLITFVKSKIKTLLNQFASNR